MFSSMRKVKVVAGLLTKLIVRPSKDELFVFEHQIMYVKVAFHGLFIFSFLICSQINLHWAEIL